MILEQGLASIKEGKKKKKKKKKKGKQFVKFLSKFSVSKSQIGVTGAVWMQGIIMQCRLG